MRRALQREAEAGKAFLADVAGHQMTVLHEEGLYRHIRYGKPGSSFYWFELVTWPGFLVVNGDMGCWTFARLKDMFEFFRGTRINPSYWDEKVRGDAVVERYSEELFRLTVAEQIAEHAEEFPGLAQAVQDDIFGEDLSHESYARELLSSFRHGTFDFSGAWEWNFKEHTYQFLWCCHAIVWGIAQHDAARKAVTA